jgi:pilus assembly protein Flp/PilA
MNDTSPHQERGASAVEYGLLIAGIAAVIVIATFALGGVTDAMFNHTCDELDAAASTSATC